MSIACLNRGLILSEELGDKKVISDFLNVLGMNYYELGQWAEALKYHENSLSLREEIGDQHGIATSSNNMGIIYAAQWYYAKSIRYHTRSLAIKKDLGNKAGVTISLNNIADIYTELGDYNVALDYYFRSLEIKEEINNKKGIAWTLNNIGAINGLLGNSGNAREYYQRSLALSNELGDRVSMVYSLNGIGVTHYKTGDYPKAIAYIEQGLSMSEENGFKLGIVEGYKNLGEIYYQTGDYTKAIGNGKKSLKIAQALNAVDLIKDAAQILYKAYKAKGELFQAIEMYELHIAIRDSIQSEENQREVLRQEYKMQAYADSLAFAKQQTIKGLQIAEQDAKIKLKQVQLIALLIGVILLLILVTVYYKSYMRKIKDSRLIGLQKKEVEEQHDKLKIKNDELSEALSNLETTQKQLIQSEKIASLGTLANGVAHEINNPLNFIMGGVSTLIEMLKKREDRDLKEFEMLIDGIKEE